MVRRIVIVSSLLVIAGLALVYSVGQGVFGRSDGAGTIRADARPAEVVVATEDAVARAADAIGVSAPKQVLFGDFHVHTTISFDAFAISLPVAGGEGAHPPADACDFARYCSALDFWSINDHAEAITAQAWSDTVDSIRDCNRRAGDPTNPDTVAYLGWEWTNVGRVAKDHYGHKNVVVPGLADDEIPTRPIAAAGVTLDIRRNMPGPWVRGALALSSGGRFYDFAHYVAEREDQPTCPEGVPVRELPVDCLEVAATPAVLYEKLRDWDLDSVVIPHGTTWGMYTPPDSDFDKQLVGAMHDPTQQRLVEVYSGHGDSEPYRSWLPVEGDAEAGASCPEPRSDYLPTCWRAGEIIRQRCLDAGTSESECDARAAETRALAARAGIAAHLVVDAEEPADWLDAGQCRDCDEPAFNYRPRGSAQYMLALGNFDDGLEAPRRFRFGFIASSDNHFARPGTGYKEVRRRGFTESRGVPGGAIGSVMEAPDLPLSAFPRAFDPLDTELSGFQLTEMERQASFFLTGGLVAAHSAGRDRDAIWQAVKRNEVYATSGPRILLWFDLLNAPGSRGATLPMGSALEMDSSPIFQVRAVGSFEQQPGCPDYVSDALTNEAIERLCKGECYNPSDRRRAISRIEVVRIRPQIAPDEDVADLIDDPWRSFECDGNPAGCAATFADPDFAAGGRDAVYYARAYEVPIPGINAGGVNCERDAEGDCLSVRLCPGPDGIADECLAEYEPRAWSSPIFVDHGSSAAPRQAAATP